MPCKLKHACSEINPVGRNGHYFWVKRAQGGEGGRDTNLRSHSNVNQSDIRVI